MLFSEKTDCWYFKCVLNPQSQYTQNDVNCVLCTQKIINQKNKLFLIVIFAACSAEYLV